MSKPAPLPKITFEDHPEGIALLRDGDPVLTPKRNNLVLSNAALAEAVAKEFEQGPGKRSFTQLAYTTIDLVNIEYDMIVEAMLAYLHTDTICYFAEVPELAKRERKYWQPILDWASSQFDCDIQTFEGVMPSDQSDETVEAVKTYMNTLGSWHVAVLLDFTRGFSSLLLALAVMEGRIDAETAFTCSQVDEDYQREEWGAEEEAMERREKLKAEMLAAEEFLRLIN